VRTSEGGEAARQFYVDVRFFKQIETCLRSFWQFAKCLTAVIDKQLKLYFLHYLLSCFISLFVSPFFPSFPLPTYSASKQEQAVSLPTRIRKMAGSILGPDQTFRCHLPGLQEKIAKRLP
jgi:hypothetical protein